jgi:hypothetical protein
MDYRRTRDARGTDELKVTLDGDDQVVTVTLPDGRQAEIWPTGGVQVYTADSKHGYELRLPLFTSTGAPRPRSVRVQPL